MGEPSRGIPQPGRTVITPRQNPGLVLVEHRTVNRAVMLHGLTDGRAVGGIPQPGRTVHHSTSESGSRPG